MKTVKRIGWLQSYSTNVLPSQQIEGRRNKTRLEENFLPGCNPFESKSLKDESKEVNKETKQNLC